MNEACIIVIGSLHTDIIATGIKQFPKSGELVYGNELVIGPGGKSRNTAAMMATLLPKGKVAMIGRTAKDPYGLWEVPVEACRAAGINMDNVVILKEPNKMPGAALIPVDKDGNNQIIVLRGASADFSPADIDSAEELFRQVSTNDGYLVLSLECPLETVLHATEKAKKLNIKVVLDPGGLSRDMDIKKLLQKGLYLLKPNVHEVLMLTGIEVTGQKTANVAAQKLNAMGAENILITLGANGAYLFANSQQSYIDIPEIKTGEVKDETGCGDQTTATICAYLQLGKSLEAAAKLAVTAGTLQFYRQGIQPVTKEEIEKALQQV